MALLPVYNKFSICCFPPWPQNYLTNKRQGATFLTWLICLCLVWALYICFSNLHKFIMFRYFSLVVFNSKICPLLSPSRLQTYIDVTCRKTFPSLKKQNQKTQTQQIETYNILFSGCRETGGECKPSPAFWRCYHWHIKLSLFSHSYLRCLPHSPQKAYC